MAGTDLRRVPVRNRRQSRRRRYPTTRQLSWPLRRLPRSPPAHRPRPGMTGRMSALGTVRPLDAPSQGPKMKSVHGGEDGVPGPSPRALGEPDTSKGWMSRPAACGPCRRASAGLRRNPRRLRRRRCPHRENRPHSRRARVSRRPRTRRTVRYRARDGGGTLATLSSAVTVPSEVPCRARVCWSSVNATVSAVGHPACVRRPGSRSDDVFHEPERLIDGDGVLIRVLVGLPVGQD